MIKKYCIGHYTKKISKDHILIARLYIIMYKKKVIRFVMEIVSNENLNNLKNKAVSHILEFYERKSKYKWATEMPKEQIMFELNRLKKCGFVIIEKEFDKLIAEMI